MRRYEIQFYNQSVCTGEPLFGSEGQKKLDGYVTDFDAVLNLVKMAILSQLDLLKEQVKNYPVASLDMPESLEGETNFIKENMAYLDALVDCLYKLQPLV